MTAKQLRRFEMLFRVNEFGAARRDRFPDDSRAGRAFAAVVEAVRQLQERAMAELALRQEGAGGRRAARAALVEMLDAISRTARVIEMDDPAFTNNFHMPLGRSAQALLTAARLAAQHIDEVAPQFVDHGMPETFAADFKALVETYGQTIRRREMSKGETAAARASIDATLETAMIATRRLDVIVANMLRPDAAALADWGRSRRVTYTRRVQPVASAQVVVQPELSSASAADVVEPTPVFMRKVS